MWGHFSVRVLYSPAEKCFKKTELGSKGPHLPGFPQLPPSPQPPRSKLPSVNSVVQSSLRMGRPQLAFLALGLLHTQTPGAEPAPHPQSSGAMRRGVPPEAAMKKCSPEPKQPPPRGKFPLRNLPLSFCSFSYQPPPTETPSVPGNRTARLRRRPRSPGLRGPSIPLPSPPEAQPPAWWERHPTRPGVPHHGACLIAGWSLVSPMAV